MKKHHYILLFILLNSIAIWAHTNPKDSIVVKQKTVKTVYTDLSHLNELVQHISGSANSPLVSNTNQFRSFPELDAYTTTTTVGILDDVADFTKEKLKKWFDSKTDNKTDTLLYSANQLFKEIEQHGKFISQMTGNELIELPVGIKKSIGGNDDISKNTSITIGVIKAKIFAEYSELDLFAKLEIGELNTTLFFGASGVKLSHTGGMYGEAKLNLLADVPVAQRGGQWLLTFKGGMNQSTGNADGQTFITIDCEGNVKEVAIAADVRIGKSIAVPIKADGSYKYPNDVEPGGVKSPVNNDSYVGASFRVVASSLEDLIIEVDLPRFELKALPHWGFYLKNTLLDLSDTRNALTKINFPPIYSQQQLLVPGNEKLWRGFYADEVSIILPPEFRVKNSQDRITIGAKNLLIDNFGVSGNFYATDVMDINEGNANKWQFSVDDIEVDIQVNHFVKAKFNGEIVLPISTLKKDNKTDTIYHGALKYKGLITADRLYTVRVDVTKDVDFSIFKSKAKLFRDSYVKLEVKDNKFQPEANLTGLMSFNKEQKEDLDNTNSDDAKNGIEELNFKGLSFQNFKIQTAKRPYIHIEHMNYKDSVSLPKFYGFELGFYEIKVKADTPDNRVELGFNSYINLDKSGIHGDVRMRIIGELIDGDYLKWKYKKIEVDSIEIDVKRKSFEFNGKLHFFREHEIYGKGLAGKLDMYIESLGLSIDAKGIFGAVDDYRYWYVDAYGQPTSSKNKNFKIYDIGGGVYHHMRKAGIDERAGTMSGIYYTPDKTTRFGFKALAAFEVKKSATFTGLVAIEMSFNSKQNGGGVRRIGFYGAAALMTGNSTGGGGEKSKPFGDVKGMQKTVSDKEQSLGNFHELSIDKDGIKFFATEVFPDLLTGKELFAAQVAIDFDYGNESYFAMLDVFLNAGAIKGEGEKNRLGYLEFFDSPTDWYMYIGTPESGKRIGVKDIPIGPYMAAVNLYYITGTILPPPAAPDPIVVDILDLSEEELAFGRNFSDELALGKGYAFGATFRLGMGFDWGLVYAQIEAGVGFDLMMRNFGDAHCRGSEDVVGIDGWYATGQLYAYLVGEIGVRVKIFGFKKDIPILEAGLATLAQAQLPNPWYMVGYAGVKVRVLGVVTVKARLKIVIGEECELMGRTGVQNVVVISDITPSDKATNVDVFDAVQVAFNVPINDIVTVEEDSGRKSYKVGLHEFYVKEDGVEISGELIWNAQKDILIFEAIDVLPPEKEIEAFVKVSFEEKINGTWKPLTDKNGTVIFEEKTITFTTGKAPEKIPLRNIVYMYPIKDQKYFFPKESNTGYIQLKKGQDYLFGGPGFIDEQFYIDVTGQSQKVNFTYDNIENRLTFDIPNLQNQVTYTYKLTTTKSGDGSNENNTTTQTETTINDDVSVTNNTIAQDASGNAIYTRLMFDFTTSKHNTFVEKINSLSVARYYTLIDGTSSVGAMGLGLNAYESFGINDVKGTIYTNNKPLIKIEGIQEDTYYTQRIYPLVYQNYPLDNDIYVNRDESILGLPPIRSLAMSNAYSYYVTDMPNHNFLKNSFPFEWHLAKAYQQDFEFLRYKIVNRYFNTNTVSQSIIDQFGYIANGVFPYINREYYKTKVEYVLPNKKTGNAAFINYRNDF